MTFEGQALAERNSLEMRINGAENDHVLKENIDKHREHLNRLASNLRDVGMDQQEISGHVLIIFRQYERLLLEYLSNKENGQ